MLSKVEALHYRSLQYVSQPIAPFQVLIGPNASGKTTFLDVVALLGDIVRANNAAEAIRMRAPDVLDLTWNGQTDWFEVRLEAQIPEHLQRESYTHIQYEVRIGVSEQGEIALLAETVWLAPQETPREPHIRQQSIFPQPQKPPTRLTLNPDKKGEARGRRKVLNKTSSGRDYFQSEKTDWNNQFRLGPRRSALANLPEDEDRFPATIWFKQYLTEGVQRIMLNSEALRRPVQPQSPRRFLPDGSNLPWVIDTLANTAPDRFERWVAHVRTALPDVHTITTVERPEDRHRYLKITYDSGLSVPSWTVSDGTLRLLALTILAYLPDTQGTYLIEEPENGIHPRAVETVMDSLKSVYSGQVLLATHSPTILGLTEPKDLLCFARTPDGRTDIVRGDQHPNLINWQREISLDTLFASGVLG
jgi:predicted ATPase